MNSRISSIPFHVIEFETYHVIKESIMNIRMAYVYVANVERDGNINIGLNVLLDLLLRETRNEKHVLVSSNV